MDEADADRGELDRSLAFLRWTNRRFGGTAALLNPLRTWSRAWPTRPAADSRSGRSSAEAPSGKLSGPITLLDLGTGSADIPVAAVRWARKAGLDLRVTAVDAHEVTLDLAREHLANEAADCADAIDLVQADALELTDRFADGAFDYVHAGLFLHHMRNELVVMTALRVMDRLAARGIIWNDLYRHPLGVLGVRAVAINAPEMVKHDGPASVKAGFTKAEAMSMCRKVGIDYASWSLKFFSMRFTIAGERPGAWA